VASSASPTQKISLIVAICLIVANMIGTGVFTSLGFQVMGIQSVSALLLLWILGGVMALCGALTYAELAVAMPRSGGEYRYLSQLYHPALGFLSGWISATLGFAGPVAISAMAFGEYFSKVTGYAPGTLATILLIIVTLVNLASIKAGSRFQTTFTLINLSLIVLIIICGLVLPSHEHFQLSFHSSDWQQVLSPDFAVSLVYVSFAYSGWNAATYIAEDIHKPETNLPRALFWGSFIVMILYLLLNFIFLYSTPIPQLSGQIEVAFIAAQNIFGAKGALIIASIISIGLIASVNSMMFTGPRVTQAIGEDFPFFKKLAVRNAQGSPVYAILLQFLIALVLIHISDFKQIMTYLGFTLSLFTTLTVAGVFVYRAKNPNIQLPYRTVLYPIVPILFIIIELCMMFYLFWKNPVPSVAGFSTIFLGLFVYLFIHKKKLSSEKD
jgi:APA family basic amino acid/polyamine antiporter